MMYRSWMKNQGIPDHEFQGKPIRWNSLYFPTANRTCGRPPC
jgi:hypothetical protein